MAHIPERWDGPDYWYFVTVVTLHRQPVFAEESACRSLQNAFQETHRFYPFRLAALVILPDHWHGLIRPGTGKTRTAGTQPRPTSSSISQSVTIEQVVGAVKRNVLRDLRAKRRSIWQARFLDHRIRDEKDFLHHLEYIRLNPVKHEYVSEPDEYEWCFIHKIPFG
jgi:putative transposase